MENHVALVVSHYDAIADFFISTGSNLKVFCGAMLNKTEVNVKRSNTKVSKITELHYG